MTAAEGDEAIATFQVPARVPSINTEQAMPRTYFTEALTDYLLRRSNILGDTYEERQAALYRGGLRIHTTLTPYLQTKAEEARDVLPATATRLRRRDRVPRHPDRCDRGDGRRLPDSCPARTRSTWRSRRARPGRARRCSSSPPPCRRAPRPTTSSTGAARACCRTLATPSDPFEISDAVEPRTRHPAGDDVALDQLRLRPAGPDRRPAPGGQHDVPDGRVTVPLPRPAGVRT